MTSSLDLKLCMSLMTWRLGTSISGCLGRLKSFSAYSTPSAAQTEMGLQLLPHCLAFFNRIMKEPWGVKSIHPVTVMQTATAAWEGGTHMPSCMRVAGSQAQSRG